MKILNRKLPSSLLYWGGLLFLFASNACEPNYGNLLISPPDFPPLIFAFLNTAVDSQYVILHNATPLSGSFEKFLEEEYQLYRQAKVKLTNGVEDFVFDDQYEIVSPYHEDFEHDFVFVSAHRVHHGESFWLRVEIPRKGVYTASTTAPGDFQILSPHAQDTLEVFKPLIVHWTVSEGAAGYRVGLRWAVIDSTRFKLGRSEKLDTLFAGQHVYVEPSAERAAMVKHGLNLYYDSPGAFPRGTLGNDAIVFVEALDAPAWLARDLNQRGGIYGGPDEVRTMPGDYSNIESGRGLMSAITTKTIPLILPPQKK